MTISTFSVPIDIPWQRIAFSADMMDRQACDRELPLRWRSSLAIFEYEPPEEQQRVDGYKVSYLKVACTITGYQPDNKEIRIRDRLHRSGWNAQSIPSVLLNDIVDKYHACYGAMLEVVVAPPASDKVRFEDYPYFADFDPKKRELYEAVTDTGEVMSRSLDDVGVRLGQTTSQSHEVKDRTSVGVSVSSGPQGGLGGSAGFESTTTDLNARSSENIRTTDALRESRETLSHTTQLSQMYHQLNSYHLGTNRAAFFVLPRPHVVQSTDPDGTPRTFVDGPRQLEGIQEFMLVVIRPKSQEHMCVEAYLETAHRVQTTQPTEGATESRPFDIPRVENLGEGEPSSEKKYASKYEIEYHKKSSYSFPLPPDYVIDTTKGDIGIGGPGIGGVHVNSKNQVGISEFSFDIQPDHLTLNVDVIALFTTRGYKFIPSSFEMFTTVYLKKKDSVASTYSDTLLITGRAVCSCNALDLIHQPAEHLSIVFEKTLSAAQFQASRLDRPLPIHEANKLGASIHREMLQSLSSVDRYPRGTVTLLDTQFVAGTMAEQLRDADRKSNPRIADWPGIDEKTVRRVTAYAPSITRAQLLELPLAQQVERFGLSFTEAVQMRRALVDLKEPKGPPPIPARQEVPVPLLIGMQLREALAVLASTKLRFGAVTEIDHPQPTGTIVTQEPTAGATVEPETEVSITVASGLSVRLPEVTGLGLTEAGCRLRQAGLLGEPTIEGQPVPDARVVELEPQAGTLVTPHSPVTIRLKPPPHGQRPNDD